MASASEDALIRAVLYVLSAQCEDGHWEDFDLPVGRSDAWVTAYVGFALSAAMCRAWSTATAHAVSTAARWLRTHRAYYAGWGYNGATGPDADSTGYALRLLRLVGEQINPADEKWLLTLWHRGGGFSTYSAGDGWGMAHPDVTPVGFAALSEQEQQRLREDLCLYLKRTREADGTWPAYWWRTRHYSTYLNNRLSGKLLECFVPKVPAVETDESRAIHSAFDLAYVTGNASLCWRGSQTTRDLIGLLLSMQNSDGSWPGGRILRVMRHDCEDPWRAPAGELYMDQNCVFTTASVIAVLAGIEWIWA